MNWTLRAHSRPDGQTQVFRCHPQYIMQGTIRYQISVIIQPPFSPLYFIMITYNRRPSWSTLMNLQKKKCILLWLKFILVLKKQQPLHSTTCKKNKFTSMQLIYMNVNRKKILLKISFKIIAKRKKIKNYTDDFFNTITSVL